jgi:hypothetical protein
MPDVQLPKEKRWTVYGELVHGHSPIHCYDLITVTRTKQTEWLATTDPGRTSRYIHPAGLFPNYTAARQACIDILREYFSTALPKVTDATQARDFKRALDHLKCGGFPTDQQVATVIYRYSIPIDDGFSTTPITGV